MSGQRKTTRATAAKEPSGVLAAFEKLRPGNAKKRSAKKAKRNEGPAWKRRLRTGLRGFAWVGLSGTLILGLIFIMLYQTIDVPDPNEDFLTETSFVLYSNNRAEIGRFATQERESIPLSEMPQSIKDAVVAAENRSFWTDQGIDPRGILRAAFSNAQGNATQGASTITQQYVKILYLNQERTLTRKTKEAILSLKVQRQQSKSQVLEGYLNTIYFGRGAYGVQAAAQAYFQKPAKNLSIAESAVLASVINNPSRFDPANGEGSEADLKVRYEYTLNGMLELEMIDSSEHAEAIAGLPNFPEIEAQSTYGGQRGHMLTMVRKELLRLGFSEDEIDGGGLKVTTTFTPKAMNAAKRGVFEARPEGFSDKQLHIGVASVEPGTGAVRGFYAGQDYLKSQLNWAVEGGQAGSTFKAFALAAAIDQGFSLRDTFDGNSPYELPDGTDVENQGNQDYGSRVSMLTATENSINTAFIDMTLGMDDGPQAIVDMAGKMGIPPGEESKQHGFPSVTPGLGPFTGVSLGSQTVSPINMANGYATIANGGVWAEPYIIEKVESRAGETLYKHKVKTERAMSEDIAADVSYALEQNVVSGTGTTARALGRPAAAKTGTATNDKGEVSSAWFAGFTPQMSTAVMYVRGKGNEQLEGYLPSFFGGAFPADTWTAVMGYLMENREVVDFPDPVFVDGEAPNDGFEPAPTFRPPPPKPTRKPSQEPTVPTEEPSTKDPKPTKPPKPTPTPTQPPSQPPSQEPSCGLLGCGEPTPTQNPSPSGGGSPSGNPSQSPTP